MNAPQPRKRKRVFPGVLSNTPEHAWPEGILHHGARFLLLVALAAFVTALFPPTERMQVSRYQVDMVAGETMQAQIPFSVPKSEEELSRERADARATVPPTFNVRTEATDTMLARLERFFARVDSATASEDGDALRRVLNGNSIPLSDTQQELLGDPDAFDLLRSTALRATRELLPSGVADAAALREYPTPTLNLREGPEQERSVPRDSVLTPREFTERAVEMLPPSAPPNVQEILRLVLRPFLEYSLELNLPATEADREALARAVPVTRGMFVRDEVIIRSGDRITAAKLQEIEAYQEALRHAGLLEQEGVDRRPVVGSWLQTALILLVFGLLLFFFRREVYANFRWVLLLSLLAAAYFAAGALIAGNDLPAELLPIAFVSLTAAVLWDGRMALVLAMTLAAVTGTLPAFASRSAEVVAVTFMGGAAAALSVRAVRRRAQTWVFTAIIAGAYAATLLALMLIDPVDVESAAWALGSAGINALLSAILAMGFLPMFELFTGITTDQTLLEWADPNRNLLKRLSMEAPGTYAHTINVANLAEAAANAIEANGLLCRVGLYYHDVGKMLKPHYFVENQPDGRNPHDRLKPDTSAAIVKEHVVEGHRLARDGNVPAIVADFILEHHGTQRIGFFWEKAKEEYGEDNLAPEDFRYPGPKPRSKETAIAMLADSVESATRALQDPTPDRVRDLIHNIVDAKIADGQLDDSPLTLREIAQVKDQFVKVLSGIYHHRIDYPQTKHLTESREKGDDGPDGGGNGAKGEGRRDGGDAGTQGAGDGGRGDGEGDDPDAVPAVPDGAPGLPGRSGPEA